MTWEQARQALKTHWGYEDFRPPQDAVVRALLSQRDALIVLPTGFGKSICFQIPAVIGEGLTLIVSPLIALMEDQVQDLWRRKLPAACLHSDTDRRLKERILKAIAENRLRLLYLSPETLFNLTLWTLLRDPQVRIAGLIVDEAHTLVHWGESFRPDYRRLGAVRRTLAKPFAVAAFTATADPYTQWMLGHVLELQDPEVITINPLRSQIRLRIETVWTPLQRQQRLLTFLNQHHPQAGLIYVRTRRDGDDLVDWLRQRGWTTEVYHGGLAAPERRAREQAWLSGSLPFLVCTNAFGMGINKPDCRWVLHYHPPLSPTDYIQEVGRAGRDGQPAEALMLVCEPTGALDPSDQQRQQFFRHQRQRLHQAALELLPTLPRAIA
ncbi:MAG: RecQ family ATP-dependent DNA helicase [Synechococcales cyanobacterium]